MTQITHSQSKDEINYSRNKQLLEYLQQEVKQHSTYPNDPLLFAYQELHTLVEKLLDDNNELWSIIKQHELDLFPENISTNNFDLDDEQIKNILLKEIEVGQVFYPSDIADKYGLDLKTVVETISELKQEGHFIENPE